MNLSEIQRQFYDAVTAESAAPIAGMERGLAVYRNAYRSRLIECLRNSYDRTWTWLGDEAFTAAACHHVICNPPTSWTLDDVGLKFAETLTTVLPDHPEAADLACLERAMQEAFISADSAPLEASEFALLTADFGENEWADLRLEFTPGIVSAPIDTDCVALWNAIDDGPPQRDDWKLKHPGTVLVWRSGLQPQCRLLGEFEAIGLTLARAGAPFGKLCEGMVSELGDEAGIEYAGTLLGRWIFGRFAEPVPSLRKSYFHAPRNSIFISNRPRANDGAAGC